MDDELALLLAAGERAAFHGRPASGRRAAPEGRRAGPVHRPRRGGHGGRLAARRLPGCRRPLRQRAGRPRPDRGARRRRAAGARAVRGARRRPRWRACTASSAAMRRRGALDQQAAELAGDSAEAVFDGRLGLAADAVGLGDPITGARRARPGRGLTEGRGDWWRQRVRLLWVRAELALLAGDPAAAGRPPTRHGRHGGRGRRGARGTWPRACCSTASPRSRAASPTRRCTTLRRAATLAESLGCLPLLWPSRALLGALSSRTAPAGERPGARLGPQRRAADRRRPARGAARPVAGPARRRGPARRAERRPPDRAASLVLTSGRVPADIIHRDHGLRLRRLAARPRVAAPRRGRAPRRRPASPRPAAARRSSPLSGWSGPTWS